MGAVSVSTGGQCTVVSSSGASASSKNSRALPVVVSVKL